jgi:hypothetical protein
MLLAMLAKSILALAAIVTASASAPSDDALPRRERLLLTCVGTMRAADAPAMPIVADAFVDLSGKRVDGFGARSAPIVRMTDALIVFGGTAGADGERVQGSLDRQTGKARIVVLTVSEPVRELIAMELDCRPPSIS